VPSPSMNGMMGLVGMLRVKSVFTVIFSPRVGTRMCLYIGFPGRGGLRSMRTVNEFTTTVQARTGRLPTLCTTSMYVREWELQGKEGQVPNFAIKRFVPVAPRNAAAILGKSFPVQCNS